MARAKSILRLLVLVLVCGGVRLGFGQSTTSPDAMAPEVRRQIERLSSADANERRSAAGVLGRPDFRDQAIRGMPLLIELLSNRPPTEKKNDLEMFSPAWWAIETLATIGPPAVGPLIEALDDPDELIRSRAAEALGRIGDAGARPKLLALVDDASPVVRARAALALGRMGGPGVLKSLLAAARDPHPLVGRYALDGLWLLRDPESLEPLLTLLADPQYPRKGGVARALGGLKDPRAVEPLIAALKPQPGHPPWDAAAALGQIGDRRAIGPLIALLDHPHSFAQAAAVKSLIQIGGGREVYTAITRLFRCEGAYAFSRELAITELVKIDEVAVPALADALAGDDPRIRSGAAEALKRIYGLDFARGGSEWLAWQREYLGNLDALEHPQSVSSKPVAESAAKRLVRATEFAVPGQTAVARFELAGGKLFASVRYGAGTSPVPYGDRRIPVTVPQSKTALAAWDLDGNLLWKTDLPLAYRLAVAGNRVVLAHDDGSLHAERGLIWVDAGTGNELHRVPLPGRPASLDFNRHSESLLMVLYPQARMLSIKDSWMEVRSYRMDATPAWVYKEPVSELRGVRTDGPVIVVHSPGGKEPSAVGLGAISGKPIWRRVVGQSPSVPKPGTPLPKSLEGLACIPGQGGFEFLDASTGELLHAFPRLKTRRWVAKPCHDDRISFTSMELEGYTLAEFDFTSGRLLWADRTGTVCYGQPAAWGANTVFLARRLSEGLTGTVTLVEMRIYSPGGVLLHHDVRERGEAGFWNDVIRPRVAGERLYLVEKHRVVALRWDRPPE